jgi:yeast amino acid transporter
VIFLNFFLLLIQGYETFITPWKPVDFVFDYIIIVLFLIILVGWKLWHRTKLVNLAEVDLDYGRRTYLAGPDETEEKQSVLGRMARSVTNRVRV